MKNFNITAQLYTLRKLLKDKSKDEIYDVLRQVKEIGYNSVQISGVGDVDEKIADNFKEVCEDLDLVICVTHVSLDFLENNFDWAVKYHKMWKCEYIGIGSMPDDMRNFEGCVEFVKRCNVLGRKLKEHNLTLIYHNHKFEFEKSEGKTMMDYLFENFDESIEFEIDTYWIQAGGANPIHWINKADGRMSIIHFKDFRIVKDEQSKWTGCKNI